MRFIGILLVLLLGGCLGKYWQEGYYQIGGSIWKVTKPKKDRP